MLTTLNIVFLVLFALYYFAYVYKNEFSEDEEEKTMEKLILDHVLQSNSHEAANEIEENLSMAMAPKGDGEANGSEKILAVGEVSMGFIGDKMEKGKDLKGRASKKSTQSHSKEAHQWRAHNTSVPPMGSTSAREMKEGAIKRQPRKTTKPQPLRLGRKEPSEKHSVMHNKNGKATTRKVRLVKGKSWADNTKSPVEGATSKPKETHLIATDSDEEDNEPIAKRMCRPFQHVGSPHDEKQANDEVNVKHEKTPAKMLVPNDRTPTMLSTTVVPLERYDFESDPSILSLRCPKSEEL
ncbi:hypothetical protein S83_005139, partial [Arachis hypogaea]